MDGTKTPYRCPFLVEMDFDASGAGQLMFTPTSEMFKTRVEKAIVCNLRVVATSARLLRSVAFSSSCSRQSMRAEASVRKDVEKYYWQTRNLDSC